MSAKKSSVPDLSPRTWFALKELTAAEEKKIRALVKKSVRDA